MYASGITIVARHDAVKPFGFTCQSFYSVSLDRPLISFSATTNSSAYLRIRETGKFSVNVLAQTQKALSDQFARKGIDRWAGVEWTMTFARNPVIVGALIWLDCQLVTEHPTGDHCIVIGHVIEIGPDDWHAGAPLLYFRGQYHRLHDHDVLAG
jgi:3-hydroxy-9,10-secoandrosta-1,3,5(10)-triene-9,17-dione monooxygenase reductase component